MGPFNTLIFSKASLRSNVLGFFSLICACQYHPVNHVYPVKNNGSGIGGQDLQDLQDSFCFSHNVKVYHEVKRGARNGVDTTALICLSEARPASDITIANIHHQ